MDQIVQRSSITPARQRLRFRLAIAGMLFTALVFGSNFAISRYAFQQGLTQYDMLALRFGTAGLLMLPFFLKSGLAQCGGVGWKKGLVLAVTGGFPMTFLMMTGLTMAPAAHGATIGPGTVTVIGIIGSVVMFGAALTRSLVIGIACVLAGLACLAFAGSTGASSMTLWGDLLFLGVGLLWGFYPLLIQLWRVEGLKAAVVVSVLSLAGLPLYFLFFFRGFDIAPWQVLVFHALFQGGLNIIAALWIWSWAAPILGASIMGRFPPLFPVIGTLLAIPILGEVPGPLQFTGIGLIIAGLFIASWRRPARAPGKPHPGEIPADADRQAEPERRP